MRGLFYRRLRCRPKQAPLPLSWMERRADAADVMDRTPAASDLRAAPPAAADAAPPQVQVPTVPVAAGQRLQATIVAQDGSQIWFGYRGAIIAARTDVVLQVGAAYEFLVAGRAPE